MSVFSEFLSLLDKRPNVVELIATFEGCMEYAKRTNEWLKKQFPKDVEKLLVEHAKENVYIKRKKLSDLQCKRPLFFAHKIDSGETRHMLNRLNGYIDKLEELLQPSGEETT